MAERQVPTKATIEVEGVDLPPVYVEAAHGLHTPKGSLQVSFYSEHIKPRPNLGASVGSTVESARVTNMSITPEDSYGMDKNELLIVRRIAANLILPLPFLRELVPWLQLKLNESEQKNKERK